jgi:hypothetical protein
VTEDERRRGLGLAATFWGYSFAIAAVAGIVNDKLALSAVLLVAAFALIAWGRWRMGEDADR